MVGRGNNETQFLRKEYFRSMWKAVHGPDIATSVRDFGCLQSDPSDVNEEELDGEGLEAAVKMHQFL